MKTYQFSYNNSNKTSTILIWFFTTMLALTLTGAILIMPKGQYFPRWSLLISIPLMVLAIYKLFKAASQRQSTEIITITKDGFISSSFGSVLFSDISYIKISVHEISLLGGKKYDYYKQSEADMPHPAFSITTENGKMLYWVLGEWGSLYNSEKDFSVFFDFLTTLTDHLYQYYHAGEPTNSYLKILDKNGFWKKKVS